MSEISFYYTQHHTHTSFIEIAKVLLAIHGYCQEIRQIHTLGDPESDCFKEP